MSKTFTSSLGIKPSGPPPPEVLFAANVVDSAVEVAPEKVLVHPDDMLANGLNTGQWVLISVAKSGSANRGPSPSPSSSSSTSALGRLPIAQQRLPAVTSKSAPADLLPLCCAVYSCSVPSAASSVPPSNLVPALLWPSPRVPRNGVVASAPIRDSLGRPSAGDVLQLHRCALPAIDLQRPAGSLTLRLLPKADASGLPATALEAPSTAPSATAPGTPLMSLRPSKDDKKGGAPAAPAKDSLPPAAWPLHVLRDPENSRSRALLATLALRHLNGRPLTPGMVVLVPVFGQDCVFLVESVSPGGLLASNAGTQLALLHPTEAGPASSDAPATVDDSAELKAILARAEAAARESQKGNDSGADAAATAACTAVRSGFMSRGLDLSQLGGLESLMRPVQELVQLPLTRPEVFQRYGVRPPRGVLFYGPPGTGKTYLARAMATQANASFLVINGPDLVTEYYGESESGLRGIFAAARALSPSIIFIDEIDALAPSREKGGKGSEVSSRLVTALLTMMDGHGISDGDRVVVVAATNRPESIDEALRRPGRFDRELEIGVPTPSQREGILRARLQGVQHALSDEQVRQMADGAHGFVAADLSALVAEASMHALRRLVHLRESGAAGGDVTVAWSDFEEARTLIRPSALREMAVEVPRLSWSDVGGLEDVKQRLKEAVEMPLKDPEALKRIGAVPPKGILLYGPPGCSKTLLARVVASEAKMNFLAVKGPELFSKWVGESEKAVAALFARARRAAPAVVFFDEIDGLASSRGDGEEAGPGAEGVSGRVLSVLLTEMDGLSSSSKQPVIVLAATNRPDCIDPALLRPGRFDRLIFIPPPDLESRKAILKVHLKKTPVAEDVQLDSVAESTEGYTGAEIASVCREAALAALTESLDATKVQMTHVSKALSLVRPAGVLKSQRERAIYEKFQRSDGGTRVSLPPLTPPPAGPAFAGFSIGGDSAGDQPAFNF